MEDDLEYFISFPTPKPYINRLNRKFSPKNKKSAPPIDTPTSLQKRPLKDPAHTSITLSSSNSAITPTSTISASLKDNSDGSSTSIKSAGQISANIHNDFDHDKVLLDVPADDDEDGSDEESESDFDEDLLGSSGQTLPYFGGSGGREPVVLLLGWMGADDRHLAKYSALYTARGCICVRYTAPPSYLYFRHPGSYMAPLADKLVGVLREMALHTHPLVCHAFSNHGATLYYFISRSLTADAERALQEKEQPIAVKGCVFDSCPAPRRVWSGVRAVYSTVKGPAWLRAMGAAAACCYLLGWSLLGLLTTLVTGTLPKRLPWALVQECRRAPQLFLYSEADSLISAEDIESFLTERQKLGVPVSARRWRDSPHVEHYRWHPEEYSRTVFQFLTHCLTRPSAPPTPPNSLPIARPLTQLQEKGSFDEILKEDMGGGVETERGADLQERY